LPFGFTHTSEFSTSKRSATTHSTMAAICGLAKQYSDPFGASTRCHCSASSPS